MVDLRARRSWIRRHPRGAISIPARDLASSTFLLPPPDRRLLLLANDAAEAASAARLLAARGRADVAWLDAPAAALLEHRTRPPGRRGLPLQSGAEPNRAWEPAALLRAFLPRLPRQGPAIDLACGSGRETVALALHGPPVLGVDILPDALRQARRLARAAAVPAGRIRLRCGDLEDDAATARWLPDGRFRIVLCFRYLHRPLLPAIARALSPGGWLFYQTFLEAQARAGRRPSRPAFLLRPGELRAAFAGAGLEIVHYGEGPDRRGDQLASLVARSAKTRQSSSGKSRWRASRPERRAGSIAPESRPA